ncbi:hypothetical protein MalM25_00720 [Planctomycetes bacterium MalM25]|nr:hypothetical protein MalM25_00720 [Planctomycetes bacterium MalM25]
MSIENETPTTETISAPQAVAELTTDPNELSEAAIESSSPFIGRWNKLVSTTNWEKGRVIAEWRDALKDSGAQVTDYSDEAWSRLVGNVTSQHVGRLRRAHERFGGVWEQYEGLFWSHFQAALDWEDAEMWLEGAITNSWSVSQMRAGRWEAVGGSGDPPESEVIEAQIDEDSYQSLIDREDAPADGMGADSDGEASSDDEPRTESAAGDEEDAPFDTPETEPVEAMPRVRPFEDLATLPDDVAEAFEQFKLVILSHKLTGWEAISRDDLLGALESLKALAVAPSADEAS